MRSLVLDFYGRIGLVDQMGLISSTKEKGFMAGLAHKWDMKVRFHYNEVFGIQLKVMEDRAVRSFGVRDGLLLVNPGLDGRLRNEDFILMHECAHERQRLLLGFKTREEMVSSYSQDMSSTEIGARDWVSKYTMPPFPLEGADREAVFGYFATRELREEVAMGLRDIHSDVAAIKNREKIYLSEEEDKARVNPVQKFMTEFKDELRANSEELSRFKPEEVRKMVEKDQGMQTLVRKAARFTAVADAAAVTYSDEEYSNIASSFRRYMGQLLLTDDEANRAYLSLSKAYGLYFHRCLKRGEYVGEGGMIAALDSKNMLLRARASDFVGETGSIAVIAHLQRKFQSERDSYAKWNMLSAICDIAQRNMDSEEGWGALEFVRAHQRKEERRIFAAIHNYDEREHGCSMRERLYAILCNVPRKRASQVIHEVSSPLSRDMRAGKIVSALAKRFPDEVMQAIEECVKQWRTLWSAFPESESVRGYGTRDSGDKEVDMMKLAMTVSMHSLTEALLDTLWETHPDRSLAVMESALTFPVREDRAGFLLNIGDIGFKCPEKTFEIIQGYLAFEDPQTRDYAVNALISLGYAIPERVLPVLENAVQDHGTYFSPPDYHGSVGSSAAMGLGKLWKKAPDRVTPAFKRLVDSPHAYSRAAALDAFSEVLGVKRGERLTTLHRVDEADELMKVREEFNAEILGYVKSLCADDHPGVRFASARTLPALMKYHPREVREIVAQNLGERNPTVLSRFVSVVSEYAEKDPEDALKLLNEVVRDNPLYKCHAAVKQSISYALKKTVENGADPKRILDTAYGMEREAHDAFSPGREDAVERLLREFVKTDAGYEKIMGTKSTSDYEIHDEIESLSMEGKVRPISGIKYPEDKLAVVRMDTSRAFIEVIGAVGKKDAALAQHCAVALWELFKTREPPILMYIVSALGDIGVTNPGAALHFLEPMAEGENPFIKKWAVSAVTKFAHKSPYKSIALASKLLGEADKDMKSALADLLGAVADERPEETLDLLTRILEDADSGVVWNACRALYKAASRDQLSAISNKPEISNEARGSIREHLAGYG